MPTIRDDAICIRHWDYSETSQTVSLFGREHGIIRGLAKGAKREKGAFSGGIELLTRGEIIAIVKPGRDLATLTAWDLQELFPVLTRRLQAHHVGLYLADVVGRMITDSDPHPALYDAMLRSLRALEAVSCDRLMQTERVDQSESDSESESEPEPEVITADPRLLIERVLLRFQWRLLAESGYQPETEQDPATRSPLDVDRRDTLCFSPALGGFLHDANAIGDTRCWRTRTETVRCLQAVAREATGRVHSAYPAAGHTDESAGERSTVDTEASSADGITPISPTIAAWASAFTDDADREGESRNASSGAGAVQRANRLLAAYIRTILDTEPPTMRYVFGPLDVSG